MPDYEKLYFQMFNSLTDAIELLKKAQRDAEEAYINEQPPIYALPHPLPDKDGHTMPPPA